MNLADSVPFWPLGLPGWADPWVALGMRGPTTSYGLPPGTATIGEAWDGDGWEDQPQMILPMPHLRNTDSTSEVLYPAPDLPRLPGTTRAAF